MNEAQFKANALEYIESRGAYVQKNWGTAFSGKGVPDLFVCWKGYFIALELKRPQLALASQHGCYPFVDDDRFAAKAQRLHLKRVRAAGGLGYVVNSLLTIRAMFRMLEPNPHSEDPNERTRP